MITPTFFSIKYDYRHLLSIEYDYPTFFSIKYDYPHLFLIEYDYPTFFYWKVILYFSDWICKNLFNVSNIKIVINSLLFFINDGQIWIWNAFFYSLLKKSGHFEFKKFFLQMLIIWYSKNFGPSKSD